MSCYYNKLHLNPCLQDGCRAPQKQALLGRDIGFTVFSKNPGFIHRLSGHFWEALWKQALVLCAAMKARIQVTIKC